MTTISGSDKYARVAELTDRIEAEMKRIGFWSDEPPTAEQMKFKMAYGIDTMVYDQWLQFVLLPRVRDIVRNRGAFPPSSGVGRQALGEWDGDDRAVQLTSMLCEFDRLVQQA